ncbi:hypothetical protein [Deinococcus roseus]|uniref:DUF4261 domain-containing protein n=1 Tax=Deinococcus roseus TaxID=392414 RepID=A0ABQ2D3U7_9DEIO|nr:hypothetical protein [Deinococcus roseus]GGJ41224.1 hypothetical protein GCM10008938_29050 [Deinococcus roseus]
MSFLRKFLNLTEEGTDPANRGSIPEGNSIILLFSIQPDLNRAVISLRQLLKDPNIHLERLEGQETARFQMIGHEVLVMGQEGPLPRDLQQKTIQSTGYPKSVRDQLQNHRLHMHCVYTGENDSALQQMLVLYQVAAAFVPLGLLGVVDEVALVAHPAKVVKDIALEVDRHHLKKDIPTAFWTSLNKVTRPDGLVWYATRGFERFRSPNFALLAQEGQTDDVLEVFTMLLKGLVFDKAVYQVGEGIHLAGTDLLFRELYEHQQELQGHEPVLVVEIES